MTSKNPSITVENRPLRHELPCTPHGNDTIYFKATVPIRPKQETFCVFKVPLKCPFPLISINSDDYKVYYRVVGIEPNKVEIAVTGENQGSAVLYVAIFNAVDVATNYDNQ